jgi:hypothetical protein
MLSGVLKLSRKTPVNKIGALAGEVVAVGGLNLAPAARISQTPPTKTRIRMKYGK